MGKIKDEALNKSKKYKLTDHEYKFLEQMVVLRNQTSTAYNQLASAFLSYVAGSRLGFKEGVNLQFEVDFETGSKTVAITELHNINQDNTT